MVNTINLSDMIVITVAYPVYVDVRHSCSADGTHGQT